MPLVDLALREEVLPAGGRGEAAERALGAGIVRAQLPPIAAAALVSRELARVRPAVEARLVPVGLAAVA